MKSLISESTKKRLQELAGIASTPYYETLSAALDAAVAAAKAKGYDVNPDELFNFSTGGITYGTSKSGYFSLTVNNIPQKKQLHVQLYRMDSGRYELNFYIQ